MRGNMVVFDFSMVSHDPETTAAIDCSIAAVNSEKMLSEQPYSMKTAFQQIKRFKFCLTDQARRGYTLKAEGLEFWKRQSKELIGRTIKPSANDLTVDQFTEEFVAYLSTVGKIDNWWCWSTLDDGSLVWRLFLDVDKQHMIREYLPRWKGRDVATVIDNSFNYSLKKLDFIPISNTELWDQVFVKYDSSMEVMANILRMQAIIRAEHDLPMVEK